MDGKTHGLSNYRLAEILFQSLENEEILDTQVARRYFSKNELRDLPNFKQLKLVPLKRRFGSLFMVLLNFVSFLVPLKSYFELIVWLIVRCLVPRRKPIKGDCVYVAFFELHIPLLKRVLCKEEKLDLEGLRRRDIICRLPISDLTDALRTVTMVFRMVRNCSAERRRDLRLQAWNICGLILVALYARRFSDMPIVTSSMLQRWAYVIGHTAEQAWMIQHGFMHVDMPFAHSFSNVDRIYAYSEEQFRNYQSYYGAADFRLITSDIELENVNGSKNALFLGSSAPHLEEEIKLLRALKPDLAVPLAIKLHPRHVYDERAEVLLSLADIVIPAASNPDCRVFLSHSSFYGLMYERCGIKSITFSEHHNIDGLRNLLKTYGIIRNAE